MAESPAIRKVGECPSNLTCRYERGITANGETCGAFVPYRDGVIGRLEIHKCSSLSRRVTHDLPCGFPI